MSIYPIGMQSRHPPADSGHLWILLNHPCILSPAITLLHTLTSLSGRQHRIVDFCEILSDDGKEIKILKKKEKGEFQAPWQSLANDHCSCWLALMTARAN